MTIIKTFYCIKVKTNYQGISHFNYFTLKLIYYQIS